jgi:hypothetical protein
VKRRHKFNAVPTVVDGIRFASKAEAKRYAELKLLERGKRISSLILQPRFWLSCQRAGEGFVKIGEYRADFSYWEGGKQIVEDVKGFKTPLYRWKKKHAEAQHNITIVEIGRTKSKRAA